MLFIQIIKSYLILLKHTPSNWNYKIYH